MQKCKHCQGNLQLLPVYETSAKNWCGRLGCGSGVINVLKNAKPFTPFLGVVASAALSGFTLYWVGRDLGRRMGKFIDSRLKPKYVCHSCNLIYVDEKEACNPKTEDVTGASGAATEST